MADWPPGRIGSDDMKIVIAGVARSGTTLLYESFARRLLTVGNEGITLNYEPYLWRSSSPQVADTSFSTATLDTYGIYVHTNTPLFLSGRHELHDEWLDRRVTITAGGWGLTKIIRGGGRLSAWLSASKDIHVVIILRNPMDVLNSIRGRFSFFGTEFHPSDFGRFHRERRAAGRQGELQSWVERSLAWHVDMTKAMLQSADLFPERTSVVLYENLVVNPESVAAMLNDRALPHESPLRRSKLFDLGMSSGPTTDSINLTLAEQHMIWPALDEFEAMVRARGLVDAVDDGYYERLRQRYATSLHTGSYVLPFESDETGIQLRARLHAVHRRVAMADADIGSNVPAPSTAAVLQSTHHRSRSSFVGRLVRWMDRTLLERPVFRAKVKAAYHRGPRWIRSAVRRGYARR
jgi:hypothetical protein